MKILMMSLVLLFSQVSLAQCFSSHMVRNFRVTHDSKLVIDAGRDDYILDVGFCSELRWARRIAFDTWGGSYVCAGDRVLVLDNFSNYVKQACRIYNIYEVKR